MAKRETTINMSIKEIVKTLRDKGFTVVSGGVMQNDAAYIIIKDSEVVGYILHKDGCDPELCWGYKEEEEEASFGTSYVCSNYEAFKNIGIPDERMNAFASILDGAEEFIEDNEEEFIDLVNCVCRVLHEDTFDFIVEAAVKTANDIGSEDDLRNFVYIFNSLIDSIETEQERQSKVSKVVDKAKKETEKLAEKIEAEAKKVKASNRGEHKVFGDIPVDDVVDLLGDIFSLF
jgi:hypothetical protein